jgi:hypothetical protein
MKKPDHWHGRLLRACRERPGCRSAAEHRDELATFHVCAHSITSLTRRAERTGWVKPISHCVSVASPTQGITVSNAPYLQSAWRRGAALVTRMT